MKNKLMLASVFLIVVGCAFSSNASQLENRAPEKDPASVILWAQTETELESKPSLGRLSGEITIAEGATLKVDKDTQLLYIDKLTNNGVIFIGKNTTVIIEDELCTDEDLKRYNIEYYENE